MKIKKYVVRSMPEAMGLIKKDLGSDAVILNSKEITSGGFLGMFKKKKIEVIAALDDAPMTAVADNKKQENKPLPRMEENKLNDQQNEVLDELKYLREMIAAQSFQSEHAYPPVFEHAYQFLLNQEVHSELAKNIIDSMMEKAEQVEEVSRKEIKSLLKDEMMEQLSNLPFGGIDDEQQIIQFIGPTGVGKTTTLAKVAAHRILQDKKKIAFITADTYRIAAIEQLKTYARILDVPIEVAYSLDDYKKALHKFKDYDQIFVDTAGRNFRDERYVHELKEVIAFEQYKVGTYLVLSLTSKAKDVMDIYKQFEQIPLEKVIFTKVDETLSYGSMLNICIQEQIAVAYLTNGQNVPDDMVVATPSYISELIVSRYLT